MTSVAVKSPVGQYAVNEYVVLSHSIEPGSKRVRMRPWNGICLPFHSLALGLPITVNPSVRVFELYVASITTSWKAIAVSRSDGNSNPTFIWRSSP